MCFINALCLPCSVSNCCVTDFSSCTKQMHPQAPPFKNARCVVVLQIIPGTVFPSISLHSCSPRGEVKNRAAEWGNTNGSCGQCGWTEGAATPAPEAGSWEGEKSFCGLSLARTDAPLFPLGRMKAVRSCWAGRPHEAHAVLFRPHPLLLCAE